LGGEGRLRYVDEYRNKEIAQKILWQIKNISKKKINLMEVCGTHLEMVSEKSCPRILILSPDRVARYVLLPFPISMK
jgi:hydrogenase maturation factor